MSIWEQNYHPLGAWLSTAVALAPMAVLLGCLGILRLKAHWSALLGLATALAAAVLAYAMPLRSAAASALYGALYGLLPIGWIILNVLFLYNLASRRNLLTALQRSLVRITRDRRLQLVLVAFCLGAFFEGAAGFGTPVAVTAAILMGLGFPPLTAAATSLIANTAPVPFAALGTPLIALQGVTGLELGSLTVTTARQLTPFTLLIPFWIVAVMAGWRKMLEVWPALLLSGVCYAALQLAVASLHGPWLVNLLASSITLGVMWLFLKRWQPARIYRFHQDAEETCAIDSEEAERSELRRAWLPWIILCLLVLVWGMPQVRDWLDSLSIIRLPITGLHQQVLRMPPLTTQPQAESAVWMVNWLSASGTAILLAGLICAGTLRFSVQEAWRVYSGTVRQLFLPLVTICATLGIGFVTRYSGMDGTLGLAFAQTGKLFPFFGTLLGWLGVALTGSDTSSNVLFGSLQKVTANQLGLSAVLMAAANSAGGVMGKMINAQSIVIASTATHWHGHESNILRAVFWHSLTLAVLVGLLVLLMAFIPPFTLLVPH